MKAVALTERTKARDMYDFSFLCTNAKLNYNYVRNELNTREIIIDSPKMLKEIILKKKIILISEIKSMKYHCF